MQVLHRGWTLFQVITTCSTYRKQCFLDPAGSYVKSCLLFRQLHDGVRVSEAGFASDAYKRRYEHGIMWLSG